MKTIYFLAVTLSLSSFAKPHFLWHIGVSPKVEPVMIEYKVHGVDTTQIQREGVLVYREWIHELPIPVKLKGLAELKEHVAKEYCDATAIPPRPARFANESDTFKVSNTVKPKAVERINANFYTLKDSGEPDYDNVAVPCN